MWVSLLEIKLWSVYWVYLFGALMIMLINCLMFLSDYAIEKGVVINYFFRRFHSEILTRRYVLPTGWPLVCRLYSLILLLFVLVFEYGSLLFKILILPPVSDRGDYCSFPTEVIMVCLNELLARTGRRVAFLVCSPVRCSYLSLFNAYCNILLSLLRCEGVSMSLKFDPDCIYYYQNLIFLLLASVACSVTWIFKLAKIPTGLSSRGALPSGRCLTNDLMNSCANVLQLRAVAKGCFVGRNPWTSCGCMSVNSTNKMLMSS